jgi:hypothetical protein
VRVCISHDAMAVEVEHEMDRPDLLVEMCSRALELFTQTFVVLRAADAAIGADDAVE